MTEPNKPSVNKPGEVIADTSSNASSLWQPVLSAAAAIAVIAGLVLFALRDDNLPDDDNPPDPEHVVKVEQNPSSNRPSIEVKIIDPHTWAEGLSEIWIEVQSSRQSTVGRLLYTVNTKDKSGDGHVFIKLPYDVRKNDVLAINLLKSNKLNKKQKEAIEAGMEGAAALFMLGRKVHAAPYEISGSRELTETALTETVAKSIGEVIILLDEGKEEFTTLGSQNWTIGTGRPEGPHLDNAVTITQITSRRTWYTIWIGKKQTREIRAEVCVYYPQD